MTNRSESHSKSDSKHGKQHASAEGQKGVSQAQVGSGKEHDPNNFANNRERASAAGKEGGRKSH